MFSNAAATSLSSSSRTMVVGTPNDNPRSGTSGSRRHGEPANTASIMAQDLTDLAIGPIVSKAVERGTTPSVGTRPSEGLKPVRPQRAAGPRIEPPVSVPRAETTLPSATAAAEPDDDPPTRRSGSHGLRGNPKVALSPGLAYANSDMFVLLMMTAPAPLSRDTQTASC